MKPAVLARSGPAGGCATLAVLAAVLFSGCASAPVSAPAPQPLLGLADVLDRPAERALFDGIRAYDEGQYDLAESALRSALAGSLRSARDKAAAHKLQPRTAVRGSIQDRARDRSDVSAQPCRGRAPALGAGVPARIAYALSGGA